MLINLLYPEHESTSDHGYTYKNDIIKDLNLSRIFKAMAKDDTYIYSVVNSVIMFPLRTRDQILHRQGMIKDVIANLFIFEEFYTILTEIGIEIAKYQSENLKLKKSGATITKASAIMASLEYLEKLVLCLEVIKNHIDENEVKYTSSTMKDFCSEFKKEYSTEYISKIVSSVKEMTFLRDGGTLMLSAVPGLGMRGDEFIIHDLREGGYKNQKKRFRDTFSDLYTKLFQKNVILLTTAEQKYDARELEQAGLHHILKLYQGFTNSLSMFFEDLRHQTAFYIGCYRLYSRLTNLVIPVCFPGVPDNDVDVISYKDLYDLSLAIITRNMPIGNDINKEDKKLFVISGANQGGKSTFLRSFAIAQVLMLAGMFVPARSYCCSLCSNIFTHFTRREDSAMNSGKLDEELKRMNAIIKEVKKGDMVFLNESFASTTEKEGSIIALDIADALYEFNIKLIMVTHLFEFTKTVYDKNPEHAVFLSAERLDDGTRTYKILEMPPSQTSFGMDLYDEIMESAVSK